jgi:hypothetical protein
MVCTPACGFIYAKRQQEKSWQREKKVRKEKLMTRADWMNLLQKVFNTYIRKRDEGKPCISCGTIKGQFHAGHYRSVGSCPELRFNEDNVHGQCATCNNHLSGNLINYRINLVQRIGIERVERLEGTNDPLKLTIEEIKELIKHYRNEIKVNSN